jgi:hypothetical protein
LRAGWRDRAPAPGEFNQYNQFNENHIEANGPDGDRMVARVSGAWSGSL